MPRGATTELLMASFKKAQIENVVFHSSIEEAYQDVLRQAVKLDRIVIFGSFHTVAAILR